MKRLLILLIVMLLLLSVSHSALAKGPREPAGAGKPAGVGLGKPAWAGSGKPISAGAGKPANLEEGKPAGSGAGKAMLYASEAYSCTEGAANLTGPVYGFVVMNTNRAGDLIVVVSLKRAVPDTLYDIWVNQEPGACPLTAATAVGAIHTNLRGNGNGYVKLPRVKGATRFWASVVGGGLVLRSTAVVLD